MKNKKLCIILAMISIFLLSVMCVEHLIGYNTYDTETEALPDKSVELECSIDILNQSITGVIQCYEFRIFEGHQYTYPGPQLTGIKSIINIRPTCFISDESEPMRNGSNVMIYVIRMSGNYTTLEFEGFVQFTDNIPPEGYQINKWGYYEFFPQAMIGIIRFDTINGVNIFKSFEEITKPEGTHWGWNMDGCD